MDDSESQDQLQMVRILGEAQKLGFNFGDPVELQELEPKHKHLVPILLNYLHILGSDNYKELIYCALSVKGFYEATEVLLNQFRNTEKISMKWRIGDALYFISDVRYEEEYINIIKDTQNRASRQMVIVLLGKLKSEKAIPELLNLLNDEEVNGHVVMALGYYNKPEFIPYIEPFLRHPKAWIRKEAKRSIEKSKNASKK